MLEPTALAALMKAAAMPPGRFLRHASISAFMNLARRCGVVDEMRNHLKSDLVRDSWVQDGSRSPAAWNDEVDRWAAAHPAQRERGLPFLRAQGFTIPGLPTIPSNGPKKSQATLLIELALSEVSELFHDPEEEPFATLPIDKHFETHRLRSRQVKNWLQHQFYLRFKKAASSHVVQSAVDVLDAEAVFMGNTHPVFVRVGELDGSIYLDLGDPEWRAVKITPEGWSVEQEPDLKFRRPKGLAALPEPSIRGSAKGLMEFLNIIEEDWPLLLGWLLGTLKPDSPYPVLVLHGEQGSAKSTTARVLKAVVDPSIAPLRTEPRNSRDLMVGAVNNHVMALDNLSRVQPWLSDALCTLATGGGFATRTLYENDEETILNAQRPVILTGIDELARRGDLLSRCIILRLPVIQDSDRRTEAELMMAFENTLPDVLGGLLDAAAQALAQHASLQLPFKPRMADFATWVEAGASALGLERGQFLDAYARNRVDSLVDANDIALDVSPLPGAIRALMSVQKDCAWVWHSHRASGGAQGARERRHHPVEDLAENCPKPWVPVASPCTPPSGSRN